MTDKPDILALLTSRREELKILAAETASLYEFADIAAFLSRNVEPHSIETVQENLETSITKEQKDLAIGIEDYGIWRARHNNASYDEYVRAKKGKSRTIDELGKAREDWERLKIVRKRLFDRFGSLEQCLALRDKVHEVVIPLLTPSKTETRFRPKIEPSDKRLCLAWANKTAAGTDVTRALSEALGRGKASRLLSARAAEKAVAAYYSSLGHDVADIAIGQVRGDDDSWKDYDIRVGDTAIDVKNARRSKTRPRTYVEHCVPRFKMNRRSGAGVTVAGVLSDWGSEADIVSGQVSGQVLGEIRKQDVDGICSWIGQRFEGTLSVNGLWRPGHLPGWIFEYPSGFYKSWAAARVTLPKVNDALRERCTYPGEDIPGWCLALCPDRSLIEMIELPETKRQILSDLYRLDDALGFSRPSLYLYLMGAVLEAIASGGSPAKVIEILNDLIFPSAGESIHGWFALEAGGHRALPSGSQRPLFLIDTEKYVDNLIALIDRIHKEIVKRELHLTAFSMPHPSILRGRRKDGSWITLIAYCGGSPDLPDRTGKCGASPLYIGQNRTCPACKRLICHECGHCLDGCKRPNRYERRLAEF